MTHRDIQCINKNNKLDPRCLISLCYCCLQSATFHNG